MAHKQGVLYDAARELRRAAALLDKVADLGELSASHSEEADEIRRAWHRMMSQASAEIAAASARIDYVHATLSSVN